MHFALTNQLHGALESPPQPGIQGEDVDVNAGRDAAEEREERHTDNGAEAGDLDISSSARRSVRWQDNSFQVGIAISPASLQPWRGTREKLT